MDSDLSQVRQRDHQLIESLSDEKLGVVCRLLEVLVAPPSRLLPLAPTEEEEITPETAAKIERARAALAAGDAIPHGEILREFDLAR